MRKIIFCLCFTLTLFFIVDTTCYSKGSSGGGGGRSSVSSSRSSASISSKPSVSTSKPSMSTTRSSSTSSYNQQKKDEDKKKKDEEERARRDNTTNNYYTRNESSGFGVGSFLGGLGVGALLFGDDDSPKHSTDTLSSQDGSNTVNVDKEQLQNANDQLAESKENKPEEDSSSIVEIILGILVGSFVLYNAVKILKRV